MDYVDEFAAMLNDAERDLRLPVGFVRRLLDEDDWSFVIKGHALLEAAFNQLIIARLEEADLADIVSHFELSGAKVGKLAIAEALNLVTKSERRFIRTFSELRNKLVHDVRNVEFSFATYIGSLDTKQLRSFQEAFFYFVEMAPLEARDKPYKIALADPKTAIWDSITLLISQIRVHIAQSQLEQAKSNVYVEAGKIFYKKNKSVLGDLESSEQ